MPLKSAVLLGLAASGGLLAQSAPRTFEVASIKPAAPNARGAVMQFLPGGAMRVINLTLKQLLAFAYDVPDFQLEGGPGWINSDRYDIQARSERVAGAPVSVEEMRRMTDDQRNTLGEQMRERMRGLLADRFQLAVHRETREAPVYALLVAKGGPKLEAVPEGSGGPSGLRGRGPGQLTGTSAPLQFLANSLSRQLGRPVIDKTSLKGHYNFTLQWTPEGNGVPGAPLPPGVEFPPPDPNGPTLFTALQEQLGLRLESQKGQVEMVVIDRVEKASEN